MEYRTLGASGLKVSAIGLGSGSATFAGKADEQTSIAIINSALEQGINYFDSAETYAEGRAERLLGKALKGNRSNVIIATKFGKDRSVDEREQPASRGHLVKALEGSLRRLDTDYIDLYIMHQPDPGTPIAETLGALTDLVRCGKIRYIGCSDFASWQVVEAAWTSKANHLESFITAGSHYNLISRDIERELVPACASQGIGVMPTSPLASSFLTAKYRKSEPLPEGTRFSTVPAFTSPIYQDLRLYQRLLTDSNFAALSALESFASERGRNVIELALGWLLSHAWLGAVPVGVSSVQQLAENVKNSTWRLSRDEMAAFDQLVLDAS
jgi:aryl-alcohol dehydrogenase-like predicted oxidoreductase